MAEPRPSAPQSRPGTAAPPPVAPEPRKRASAARSAGWRPGTWWPRDRATWLRTIAVVAGLVLLLLLGTLVYAAATLPDPSKLDLAAGTVIVKDRNGQTIEQRNAQGLRVSPV